MTAPGEQIVAEIVSKTDTVLLGMSCGKDSIAAWLAIKPHFRRIVPYHMHLVPDLEFVERGIRHCEEFRRSRAATRASRRQSKHCS